MSTEDVLEDIDRVEVSASRKKQFDRYEPASSNVTLEAEVPEGVDTEEFVEALQFRAGELASEDIMRKYEAYVDAQVAEEEDE